MAEAQLAGILRSVSGTIGNFNFRTTKNGAIIADLPTKRTTAPSTEQFLVQAFFSTASKQWKNLTDAQRTSWSIYAGTYFPNDKDGNGAGPTGQAVFLKAAWYQQASGLALPTDAPIEAPPAAPTGLTPLSNDDPLGISFQMTHSVTPTARHRVFVEITPALASAARHPQPQDYRSARGINVGSFPDLAASGSNYTVTGIRYPFAEGVRFGLRVTIISPDGIPSAAFSETVVKTIP